MAGDEEFVTIVPVGEARPPPPTERDPAFVTVLTVGAAGGAAEVLVRRPRGARLGLGLKFEGGSAAAERVRRLLVQSCAPDSPAAAAATPWGKLIPGDEILAIDGAPVSDLTRIDCVRRLKDSDEALKLLVRHLEEEKGTPTASDRLRPESTRPSSELQRPTCLPPPVPPRKLNKKNSFKDRPNPLGEQYAKAVDTIHGTSSETAGPQVNGRVAELPASLASKLSRKSSFDSHIHRQAKESLAALKRSSPEEVRRLARRLSDGKAMPAEAEVYMDLLSAEWERCLALADAESDDTGSSISTVVDRLGSLAGSVESSIPSTPTMQPKTIDIQRVLNCIENIDSDLLKDIATTRFVERPIEGAGERPVSRDGRARGFDETDSTPGVDDSSARKKNICNDKNNNHTIVRNVTCISIESSAPRQVADRPESKAESGAAVAAAAKPKPLPRSTRPEPTRAAEAVAVAVPPPQRVPNAESEALLTPTKKTCIESWLQRSEAELTCKRASDASAPEALPRLIDFVPKPQFRSAEAVVAADKSPEVMEAAAGAGGAAEAQQYDMASLPLPPAPAESREDGSGASLDTIGEMDEGTDITHPEESAENNKHISIHKKYESSFWESRTSRNDTEDTKSLSNDETLPTCPRQPPDGVETPCDAVEKAPELLRPESPPPPLPTSTPTALRLPPRLPLPAAPWPAGRVRTRTSYSRSQDARSECSVKDKIAMFSSARAASVEHVDSCGLPRASPAPPLTSTLPSPITHRSTFYDVQTLDRRLTKSHENLDEVPRAERSYSYVDKRPEVLGALLAPKPHAEGAVISNSIRYSDSGAVPLLYGSTTHLDSLTPRVDSAYHARSISDDGAVGTHKSTLEYLIEQRKKSMSKLRGLMIPEVQAPIVDLPEIKVQECNAANNILFNRHQKNNDVQERKITTKMPLNFKESWKMNLLPNNIPKYSPAFKRKSLQVYAMNSSLSKESTPERKLQPPLDTRLLYSYAGDTNVTKHIPTKPPRTSIDTKKMFDEMPSATLPSRMNLTNALKLASKNDKNISEKYRGYGNVEVKVCTTTDIVDSDDDSAVSSTQSSYRSSASSPLHVDSAGVESDSSHLSPHYISYSLVKAELPPQTNSPSKPSTEYEKRNVCRSVSSDTNVSVSSSAGSAATSGSQASCSSLESSVADSNKKKVTRTHSVDTINRRNILASAKCRSGRDLNVGSPVVDPKFSHESPDISPSPHKKTSDRLTTLASNVSGLSNKGETRRIRSKVISDTDSDSENEVNVRQRKSEFKNSRLKKMSNSQLPKVELARKQPDRVLNDSVIVVDEVPQVISQRIIKEIKKAGLHNHTTETNVLPENTHTDKQICGAALVKKNGAEIPNDISVVKIKSPTVVNKSFITDKDTSNTIQHVTKPTITSGSEDQIDSKPIRSYKICLKKGVGTGVGLILAGGVDCEAKVVTVHKVLAGGVAEREGLQRGARVLSINGRSMEGLTHADTVTVLKEPRSEVIIEIEDDTRENVSSLEYGSDIAESKESDASSSTAAAAAPGGRAGHALPGPVSVTLEKSGAGAGLGFGLEGGKDSPSGDHPLTIKKLFAGGAAARSGRVAVGAQLLSAGGLDMRGLTRTQAWAALKALPPGPVALCLHNPR